MFFSLFPWLQGRKECFNPNRGESDSNNEGGIQFIDRKCVHYKITFNVENTLNSIPFRCYK